MMSDYEQPSAFTKKERKARVTHKCCECRQDINIREVYEYCSGIWDSTPDSYKTCLSCVTLRDDYQEKTGEELCFEGLREGISQAFSRGYGVEEFSIDYPENEAEMKKLFRI